MSFKFDPNSTKNEGRWRLIDPKKFVKDKGSWFRKKDDRYPGISYVFGHLKDKHGRKTGGPVRQTIRFDKRIWSENKAKEWWEEHSREYNKEWTPQDWVEWEKEQEEEKIKKEMLIKREEELREQMSDSEGLEEEYESARKKAKKQKPKSEKISRRKALALSKKIIESLGVKYVPQKDVTINSEWKSGIGFPAGSVRQGKEEVGDLDIIVTKPITREMVEDLGDENITDLRGGEKRIDFVYNYKCSGLSKTHCRIGVNIFIYRDKKTWGAALIHTTGPWQYNVYIRRKVKSFGEGWTLSQNGLVNGFDEIIPTPTEKSLMSKIGVTIRTPAERREHSR